MTTLHFFAKKFRQANHWTKPPSLNASAVVIYTYHCVYTISNMCNVCCVIQKCQFGLLHGQSVACSVHQLDAFNLLIFFVNVGLSRLMTSIAYRWRNYIFSIKSSVKPPSLNATAVAIYIPLRLYNIQHVQWLLCYTKVPIRVITRTARSLYTPATRQQIEKKTRRLSH